jgi:hypothetical protein
MIIIITLPFKKNYFMKKNLFSICLFLISSIAVAQPINNITFSTKHHIDTNHSHYLYSYKLATLAGNDGYSFTTFYDDVNYDQTFYISQIGFDGSIVSDTIIKFDKLYPSSGSTSYINMISNNGSLFHTATTQFSNINYNNAPFVFKTDVNGNVIWNKIYNNDTITNYVDGSFASADNGMVVFGNSEDYNNNIYGKYILKTDANGTLEWSKFYKFDEEESYISMQAGALLSDGSFLFSGVKEDNSIGANYFYLLNISADGTLNWEKNYEFDSPFSPNFYINDIVIFTISGGEALLTFNIGDPQTETNSIGVMNISQTDGSVNWVKKFTDPDAFWGISYSKSFIKNDVVYLTYNLGGGAFNRPGSDIIYFGIDRNGNQTDVFNLHDPNMFTYGPLAFTNTNDNGLLIASEGYNFGHPEVVFFKTDQNIAFSCMEKNIKPLLDEELGAVVSSTLPSIYIDFYLEELSYNLLPYDEVTSYTESSCSCVLSVKGNVYKSSTPAENTEVALYKYDAAPGRYLLYSTTLTDASGFYIFDYVPEANYIIKAVTDLPGYVPTFYNNSAGEGELQWENAEVVAIACHINPMLLDVILIEAFPQSGTGVISGHVYELEGYIGQQFRRAPGEPIPDIDITVDQSPGGSVNSATTDVNGYYEFTGLNNNATFIVRANIPGLPNDSIYTITIDLSTTTFSTLDFWVDSVGVYIIADTATGINNTLSTITTLEVAPNPALDNVNLTFYSKSNSSAYVSILNTLGEEVYQLQTNIVAGSNRIALNLRDLANGVYFIQLNDGVQQQTKKLIKQTR